MAAHQPHDLVDHTFNRQRGGVDRHRVAGPDQRGRGAGPIAAIAGIQRGGHLGDRGPGPPRGVLRIVRPPADVMSLSIWFSEKPPS